MPLRTESLHLHPKSGSSPHPDNILIKTPKPQASLSLTLPPPSLIDLNALLTTEEKETYENFQLV
ncbi:hypothetical protein Bca4012_065148 [Brassica carinata]